MILTLAIYPAGWSLYSPIRISYVNTKTRIRALTKADYKAVTQ
jgi:hypothetical protein